jgi:DNA-3-methyladenine glycosylase I
MPGGDAPIPSYCDFAPGHPWHGPYHEREYGFPITDEHALFERLILEINQAGVELAHHPQEARGLPEGLSRLRRRSRRPLPRQGPRAPAHLPSGCPPTIPVTRPTGSSRFKKTFVFTAGEIVGEFLMSIGYLPGAHRADCPIHRRIAKLRPPWIK